MKLFCKILLVTLLIACCVSVTSCEKKNSGWMLNLDKGYVYQVKTHTEQTIVQEVQGNKIDMLNIMDMYNDITVKGKDKDGNYILEFLFTRMRMDASANGQSYTIDTDSTKAEDDSPITKMYDSILKQGLEYVVDEKGKVIDIRNYDKLVAVIAESIPGFAQNAQLKQLFEKQFSKRQLLNSASQNIAMLPEKPVVIGDEWNNKTELNLFFPAEIENKFVFKAETDNEYEVATTTDMDVDSGEEGIDVMGTKMNMQLKLTQKGTSILDKKTCFVKGSNLIQEFSGKFSTVDGKFEMPIEGKSEISITVTKK